jgi:hypothetical protein
MQIPSEAVDFMIDFETSCALKCRTYKGWRVSVDRYISCILSVKMFILLGKYTRRQGKLQRRQQKNLTTTFKDIVTDLWKLTFFLAVWIFTDVLKKHIWECLVLEQRILASWWQHHCTSLSFLIQWSVIADSVVNHYLLTQRELVRTFPF